MISVLQDGKDLCLMPPWYHLYSLTMCMKTIWIQVVGLSVPFQNEFSPSGYGIHAHNAIFEHHMRSHGDKSASLPLLSLSLMGGILFMPITCNV